MWSRRRYFLSLLCLPQGSGRDYKARPAQSKAFELSLLFLWLVFLFFCVVSVPVSSLGFRLCVGAGKAGLWVLSMWIVV